MCIIGGTRRPGRRGAKPGGVLIMSHLWRDALAQAREIHNERETEYLIDTPLLADYLEEALDALGYSPEDYKTDRVQVLGDPVRPVRGHALSQHSHPENAETAVSIL